MRWCRSFIILLPALCLGCAGALPEPVYVNQLEEYFPEPEEGAADAEAQRAIREEAEDCAARLNSRRSTAEIGLVLQGIVSGIGGAAGAAGGVLSAIDFGDQDVTTAMGSLSAAGAGVTMIGNLLIGFLANPAEELRLRAQGQRSWELAVELRYAEGNPDAIREALERCTRDEAPPIRLEGSGAAFSR